MLAKILEAIVAIFGIIKAVSDWFKKSISTDVAKLRKESHDIVEKEKKTGRPSE